MNSYRVTGFAVVAIGLLTFFLLIPYGIVSPENVESLALAPDFWPRIVAAVFTLMGAAMVIRPVKEEEGREDPDEAISWGSRVPRLAFVLALLFGFYYAVPSLGMVVPAMVLIVALMLFSGERRWLLIAAIALAVPVLLYCFFVFVANIPIPLGVFDSLRG